MDTTHCYLGEFWVKILISSPFYSSPVLRYHLVAARFSYGLSCLREVKNV